MSTKGLHATCAQIPEVLPQARPVAALPPQLQQAAAGQGGDTGPGAAQQGQAQLHHAGEDRDDGGDDDHDDDGDHGDDANVSAARRRHAACIQGDTWPAALPATGRSMLLLTSGVIFINQTLFLHLLLIDWPLSDIL